MRRILLICSILISQGMCYARAESIQSRRKVIVVVLDGVSWEIAEPFIQLGELPTLKKMIDQGAWALVQRLEGYRPEAIWLSMSSGYAPAPPDQAVPTHDSYTLPCLWTILENGGKKIGLYKFPKSWVNPQHPEFCVPGVDFMMDRAVPDDFSFAFSIDKTLDEHIIQKQTILRDGIEQIKRSGYSAPFDIDSFVARVDNRRNAHEILVDNLTIKSQLDAALFTQLYQRYQPDFAMCYLSAPGSLMHAFWKSVPADNAREYSPLIEEYIPCLYQQYKQIDEMLETVLRMMSPETSIIVLTDPGLRNFSVEEDRTVTIFNPYELLDCLDLPKVTCFSIGVYQFFLPMNFSPHFAPEVVTPDNFVQLLRSISTGEDDGQILQAFTLGNSMAFSKYFKPNPESIEWLAYSKCRLEANRVIQQATVSKLKQGTGFMVLLGKGIRAGSKIREASVADLLPTVLSLIGLPIDDPFDGKVLIEGFKTAGETPKEIKSDEADLQQSTDIIEIPSPDRFMKEELALYKSRLGFPAPHTENAQGWGFFKAEVYGDKMRGKGRVEAKLHGGTEKRQCMSGEQIELRPGVWDIALMYDDESGKKKQLVYEQTPIAPHQYTILAHNTSTSEVHIKPTIVDYGLSFGNNAYFNLYTRKSDGTEELAYSIRSSEEGEVTPGTYDIKVFFDSGVPRLIEKNFDAVSLIPGTTYQLSIDLEATLARYMFTHDSKTIKNGRIDFFKPGSAFIEASIEFNRMIIIKPDTYRVLITWTAPDGSSWQTERKQLQFRGEHGKFYAFRFDPENEPNKIRLFTSE